MEFASGFFSTFDFYRRTLDFGPGERFYLPLWVEIVGFLSAALRWNDGERVIVNATKRE